MTRIWFLAFVVSAGCGGRSAPPSASTLVAFNAGSLARPLRAALDSFARREGVSIQQESAGSLETARKLTELGKIPDILALADDEVFPRLLMPSHATWYVPFARNRMVIAYTENSRGAKEISTDNWWQVLQRPGVETGRSNPDLDPNGYRTLLVLQLAERHYAQPGLAQALRDVMPARNVRPKEADLVGLLQAGEFDYIWSYESMARTLGLNFVRLPDAIDLSSPADSAFYAQAHVRVRGNGADFLEFQGRAIVNALSIPLGAPHPAIAVRFIRFLLSAEGRRVLRQQGLEVLEAPFVVGTGAPAGLLP